jgi:hypothetical protein
MSVREYLTESSLSRLWKHNEEHDCGALTAFRKGEDCGEGRPYTKKENKQRNKSLRSKLVAKGYGVTELHGIYPEGGTTQKENSFFVVDLEDTGGLEKELAKLGELFDQDSILIIPKGAIKNEAQAFLFGTNKCPNNWLGYHKKEVFSKGKVGYESKIYTSYVKGRPFIFEEVGRNCIAPGSGMGVWALHVISEKNWQDIDVD